VRLAVLRPFLPCLLLLGAPAAADDPIPDPLSLEQALAYAEAHPRVALGAAASDLPRSPPLYLDCERLAFSQLEGDDSRARPADVLLAPLAAQRLEIMERFLDVLLADLSYARFNEAMAVAYIQYDRANTRRELGQYAEVLVAELETRYEDVLRRRAASAAAQRLSRDLLAQAMGRPGELPRELTPPALILPPEDLPDLPTVMARAGDQGSANTARAELGPDLGDARRRLLAMELRRQALELLLRLQILQTTARYAESESFLSDLRLDESRTLYEQEVKADLGYSMSRQTEARMREQQVRYCRALAWAELNALQGGPVPPTPTAPPPETTP
jgi:hypothetical protein